MSGMEYDIVVVGAGNAAMCAALAARESGKSVLVLERANEDEANGNSRFTAGAMRIVYEGVDDLRRLMPDLSDQECADTDFGTYTQDNFYDDMARVTQYRADPDMVEILVTRSFETVNWMRTKGIRFAPIWGRQAFKIDGKFKFWGGLTVETTGGGPGLTDGLTKALEENGIDILYGARALSLIFDGIAVNGVKMRRNDEIIDIAAKSVVLASGGFQANAEMRTRYLGPGWELAKVRGTRFNTGDGINMALDVGAMPWGNWSGGHAVGWERNAPDFGDLAVGDQFQKHSYPFTIMVNADGRRFVDEGADFRNYTYAKYGKVILEQPGQFAWQVFDKKSLPMKRDEYNIRQVTKVTADTIEELAGKLEGVNPDAFLETVKKYNAAVTREVTFNPNIKDGLRTEGLKINKSNWANPVDEAPFEAYAVTCGLSFTFGGLKINTDGQVLDTEAVPIKGLFAAGELVGGLFYFNYPGGSGLTAGSVFGRLAGTSAAKDRN
ncbi:MAG: FAD-dependent tricarballylate dehydrogenase TcuA [Pseudomonadota bacterium]|nr:FAD-dependent tricarballylate dehydrogenase TcuA [Pseudomonadota bacterium]